MADTMILGENVLIEFYKDGDFYTYRCAIDVSINVKIQTKEVRTIGDGYWSKTRGRKAGYSVSLSGLIDIDESSPTAWLLENYARNMTHIDFRLYFSEPSTNLEKIFEGKMLITDLTMGGGATGFATGNMEFEGFGAYTLSNALVNCNATIGSASVIESTIDGHPADTASVSYTGLTNSTRIEYAVDGGGRDVIISPAPNGTFYIFGMGGSHTIILYPICSDGDEGTPYTINFTIS